LFVNPEIEYWCVEVEENFIVCFFMREGIEEEEEEEEGANCVLGLLFYML